MQAKAYLVQMYTLLVIKEDECFDLYPLSDGGFEDEFYDFDDSSASIVEYTVDGLMTDVAVETDFWNWAYDSDEFVLDMTSTRPHFEHGLVRDVDIAVDSSSGEVTSCSGPWFNIKMSSYQYRKSHCGDKTVVRSSYLYNGISYTSKMSSLYWIRALAEYYSANSDCASTEISFKVKSEPIIIVLIYQSILRE